MQKTEEVDAKWLHQEAPETLELVFPVPLSHDRYQVLQSYTYRVDDMEDFTFDEKDLIIVDKKIEKEVDYYIEGRSYRLLEAQENETKTLNYLDALVRELQDCGYTRVVGIGDGVILSICGYLAEQLHIELALIPTTIISMCDTSIGGKVRVNDIKEDVFHKNAHRSYYEPSEVLVDPAFLVTHTDHQVRYGLAKIIKHGLYQSEKLLAYLLSDEFSPFNDRKSLLKAILWTVELKRACIEADPYIIEGGSDSILRAAHDISDRLEEESGLIMSHGEAVLRAIEMDLRGTERYEALVQVYRKLAIPL